MNSNIWHFCFTEELQSASSATLMTLVHTHTHLSQMFRSLLVFLLHAHSFPVDRGCLEALGGHDGIRVADKNGVVGSASSIQPNKVVVADGHLAVNGKKEKKDEPYYEKIPPISRITVTLSGHTATADRRRAGSSSPRECRGGRSRPVGGRGASAAGRTPGSPICGGWSCRTKRRLLHPPSARRGTGSLPSLQKNNQLKPFISVHFLDLCMKDRAQTDIYCIDWKRQIIGQKTQFKKKYLCRWWKGNEAFTMRTLKSHLGICTSFRWLRVSPCGSWRPWGPFSARAGALWGRGCSTGSGFRTESDRTGPEAGSAAPDAGWGERRSAAATGERRQESDQCSRDVYSHMSLTI